MFIAGVLHRCRIVRLEFTNTTVQTGTDYGQYLANEAPPLHTTAIVECCTRRLADAWHDMRCNADDPLATFLDYCTYGHMIDNVVLIVTGLLHERDVQVRARPDAVSAQCICHVLLRMAVMLKAFMGGTSTHECQDHI